MSGKKEPEGEQAGQATKKKKKLTFKERAIKAMAHPLRVRILAYMNDRPWSPNELSEEFAEGLSQVSYHVKVLKDFELIEMTSTEPRRGAVEHFYRAVERFYLPSTITKQFPKTVQRGILVDILDDTNKDVAASLKSGRFDEREDYHASYTTADFDEQACEEAEKLADELVDAFIELEAQSAKRRSEGKGSGAHIPTSLGLLVYGSERAKKEKAPSRKARRAKKAKAKNAAE